MILNNSVLAFFSLSSTFPLSFAPHLRAATRMLIPLGLEPSTYLLWSHRHLFRKHVLGSHGHKRACIAAY
jgi:hypothetical protein